MLRLSSGFAARTWFHGRSKDAVQEAQFLPQQETGGCQPPRDPAPWGGPHTGRPGHSWSAEWKAVTGTALFTGVSGEMHHYREKPKGRRVYCLQWTLWLICVARQENKRIQTSEVTQATLFLQGHHPEVWGKGQDQASSFPNQCPER